MTDCGLTYEHDNHWYHTPKKGKIKVCDGVLRGKKNG